MTTGPAKSPTDDGTLLFGAGFAFGVMTTLVLVGVVLAVLAGGVDVPTTLAATVAAGVVFAGIVGSGLFLLAFPANRTRVSVDRAAFGLDDEE